MEASLALALPETTSFPEWLSTGHRVAIVDNTVTTVLPPMHHKRQVHRVGLGRFGNGNGGWGDEA